MLTSFAPKALEDPEGVTCRCAGLPGCMVGLCSTTRLEFVARVGCLSGMCDYLVAAITDTSVAERGMGFGRWMMKNGPGSVGSTAKTMAKAYTRIRKQNPGADEERLLILTLRTRPGYILDPPLR